MKTTQIIFPLLDGKNFLQKDTHRRVELLYGIRQVGRVIVSADYSVARKGYDSFAIVYVRRGRLILISDGKKYVAGPGDLIFYDQRKPYTQKNESGEPLELIGLYIYGANTRGFFDAFYAAHGCLLQNYDGALVEDAFNAISSEIENGGDEIKISIAVHTLLSELLRTCDVRCNDDIADVIQYVCDHFTEKITTVELARKFYMDKFYLIRKFHARTGFMPREYISRLRFDHSIKLLEKTEMPIAEVARKVGFNDAKRLNELFASHTDLTPSEYRAQKKQPRHE